VSAFGPTDALSKVDAIRKTHIESIRLEGFFVDLLKCTSHLYLRT